MSEVTLDALLNELGMTHLQLEVTCTRQHLQDIALFLKSWRTVAPYLGLSTAEVEEIERDGKEEKERRLKTLESWKSKFAFKATYMVLIETFLKIGQASQAEQVCHVLVPQSSKKGIWRCVRITCMLRSHRLVASLFKFIVDCFQWRRIWWLLSQFTVQWPWRS